jgi:hypothetical protein
MFSQHINYPILQENPRIFAICLLVVLAISVGLFVLSRWRRSTAVVACLITCAWIILLLPDVDYYFSPERGPEWIVEPFYRQHYVLGYLLIFMPVPFVLVGWHLLRRRNI